MSYPNPDPTIPCIGCESVPTRYRTSDGYAICGDCLTTIDDDDPEDEVRPDPLGPIARRLETVALRIAAGTITTEQAVWHLQRLVLDLRVLGSDRPAAL